ncbi:ArsC family reductase [Undibacterium arcticum]|uniref:ArsC family reductase n=1 Tax=Undibacterium arcticum TaxID=1762892 RepID=A0ABV7F4Z5_9BURK
MQITLYGIPNCDQVKKARTWLDAHGKPYAFHDFKKAGINRSMIDGWLSDLAWDVLLNRKGTTWRALPDERKAVAVDAVGAAALMLESPSIVKRPVLCVRDAGGAQRHFTGFSDELYRQIFQ